MRRATESAVRKNGHVALGSVVGSGRLLVPEDVAERLGLEKRGVYDLVQRREIGHYRLGRRIRISEEQLRAFLAEREQGPW